MNVTQYFTASLTAPGVPELYAVQCDDGRTAAARLYAGAEPWEVPQGVTAWLSYELPDGTQGSYQQLRDGSPCCTISGNLVSVRIAPTLCRAAGTVKAAIVLEQDGRQLSTFPFRLQVSQRPGAQSLDPEQEAVPLFAGKLYYGDSNGNPIPLKLGPGLQVSEGQLRTEEDPDAVRREYVDEQLEKLRADLTYEPIAFTAASIQPSLAQMGSVVEDPIVQWELNGTPVSVNVSGREVDPTLRRYVLDQTFAYTGGVTITATDDRGATATRRISLDFVNGIYQSDDWPERRMPTDAELRQMHPTLQLNREMSIRVFCSPASYVLYACPSRLGAPEFWANGFQGGFSRVGTLLHTNRYGYAEDYDVWISESPGLNLTITVK